MAYTGEFKVYEDIIEEMSLVYQHDKRPWMIGFSGGKDSTLLCCLVMEMLQRLAPYQRHKAVYIVSSDTMVENPIVKNYMHASSHLGWRANPLSDSHSCIRTCCLRHRLFQAVNYYTIFFCIRQAFH